MEYTYSSISQLQQDAVRRVREMNERAKRTLERDEQFLRRNKQKESVVQPDSFPAVQDFSVAENVPVHKEIKRARSLRKSMTHRHSHSPAKSGLGGILDIFSKDSEKTVLLLLLLLLYSEKADMKLLLAIGYILL